MSEPSDQVPSDGPVPPPPPTGPPPPQTYLPYPPPGYYPPAHPYGYAQDHPRAGLALGLGLGGLIGGFFTLGLAFGLGPFAWYIGQRTREEIRHSASVFHNEGNATAGMVLGIIATAFLVLAIALWITVILLLVNDPRSFDSRTTV